MWIDPAYPQLGASPDGLLNDPTEGIGILEIKCPYILRDNEPSDFSALTPSQRSNFCCTLDSCGRLQLKKSHSYYYQIQMQMGVVGMKFFDFVVWTCHGISVQRIYHDVQFWCSLRDELITESTWCQSISLCEYLGSSWPSGCHSSVLMTGQCKHRNTPKYTTRRLPTEIHTQLNTYGVSGCSVWLCIVFNEYWRT